MFFVGVCDNCGTPRSRAAKSTQIHWRKVHPKSQHCEVADASSGNPSAWDHWSQGACAWEEQICWQWDWAEPWLCRCPKPSVAPTNQPSCPFQVLVTYNGQECAGLTEQHNLLSDKVKVLLPEQGLQTCWRAQEVRPAMLQPPTHPAASSPSSAEALQRSVSNSIDVPKRLVLLVVSCSGGKGLLESSTVLTLGLKPTERAVMLGVYLPSQHGIIQRMGKFRIKGILNCFSSK